MLQLNTQITTNRVIGNKTIPAYMSIPTCIICIPPYVHPILVIHNWIYHVLLIILFYEHSHFVYTIHCCAIYYTYSVLALDHTQTMLWSWFQTLSPTCTHKHITQMILKVISDSTILCHIYHMGWNKVKKNDKLTSKFHFYNCKFDKIHVFQYY